MSYNIFQIIKEGLNGNKGWKKPGEIQTLKKNMML